jgi:hypothetical protein
MAKQFIVDDKYEAKLKTVNDALIKKRITFVLPKLNQEQDTALANNLSPACYRVARFIFSHQGQRTDTINQECAVGNLSDAVIGFEKTQTAMLDSIGLRITCEVVSARNRFGQKCAIGTWWLAITNHKKWLEAEIKESLVA